MIQKRLKRIEKTWQRYNRHYGWRWRAANMAAVLLILTGAMMPVASRILDTVFYQLSPSTLALIGKTDPNLERQLTYDASSRIYQFNKNTIPQGAAAALASFKQQVGTASGRDGDTSLYGLDVPTDFSRGVTYHDANTQLSFTMTPQFSANTGKEVNGHLVFPLSLDSRAIYTLKNNGLKEDIVINKASSDTMTFAYKLQLPKTLEVHKLEDGSIGIYSADPSLYVNTDHSSQADRDAIQKARENGEKTHLVFGLPAPVVKNTKGQTVGEAHFDLDGTNLRVVATSLDGIKGAFSIDPSVVVTSTSDFQTGNNEGMISFGTSGQITRDGLTGGSVGSWTATTSLPSVLEQTGAVAYDGYIYEVGGVGNTAAYSAPINSDGTIGSWSIAGTAPTGSSGSARDIVAYNGYIYDVGDPLGAQNVYYASLDDGTIGTWTKGVANPAINNAAGVAIYQNYLYLVGGGSNGGGGGYYTTVYYAALNADGSVGSWQSTSALPTGVGMGTAVAYNSNLYLIGGAYSGGFNNTIYHAHINTDGSVGTWSSSTTGGLFAPRYGQYSFASNGYLYYVAGWANKTTYYAQINANGSLGTWHSSTDAISTSGLRYPGGVTYNGYIYLLGGREESTSTKVDTVQYAKINPAGTLTAATPEGSVGEVYGNGAVVYGQCIYSFGGYGGSSYSDAVYSASISSDGTLGTWTKLANSMQLGTAGFGYGVVNGKLHVIGGWVSGVQQIHQYTTLDTTDCTTGTWQQESMSGHIGNHSAAVYNGHLYTLVNTGATTSVYAVGFQANGKIDTNTQQSSLNTSRLFESLVAWGGYLYAVGGEDSSDNVMTSVEYAQITSDGTLGAWQTTSSLGTARTAAGAVAYNGYLYAIGGYGSGSELSSTEYAKINADGSLGAWQSNTSLDTSWDMGALALSNNHIYTLSGENGTASDGSVNMMTINNGGSGTINGSWLTTPGTPVDNELAGYGVASASGYVYMAGGSAASNSDAVYYTKVNDDGSFGSWTNTASLKSAVQEPGMVVVGSYIYVVGGFGAGGNPNTIQYAKINSDGTLQAWQYASAHFPNPRDTLSVVAYDGHIYAIGGDPSESSVNYATPNADGDIVSWSTGTSLPDDDGFSTSAVAYGGHLYVLGGSDTSVSTDRVIVAPIHEDGSIGSWVQTTAMPRTMGTTAIAIDGYMYLVGGVDKPFTATTYYDSVYRASVGASGMLGPWELVSTLPNADYGGPRGLVINGSIYLPGKWDSPNGSGITSTTFYHAPIAAQARIGHYSRLVDLGASQTVTNITYNGALPLTNDMSPVTYRAAGSDGVFGTSTPLGSVGSGFSARYLLVNFTLDDSQGAVLPDSSSTPANVTDFTISYAGHPAPAQRLRQGQTLQGGVLSPLDTSG